MRIRAGRQGAMKRTKDGRWAHAACATYCPGVFYDTRYISNINKVFFFLGIHATLPANTQELEAASAEGSEEKQWF